jgi:hypothetical protein
VQAAPVNYEYADGQYWDDTNFSVPPATRRVEVRLYHQLTTREYIEFLRDENRTNAAGQVAYDQWVLHGKSEPTRMDEVILDVNPSCSIDVNGDGVFPDFEDLAIFLTALQSGQAIADVSGNGVVNLTDALLFISRYSAGGCFPVTDDDQ